MKILSLSLISVISMAFLPSCIQTREDCYERKAMHIHKPTQCSKEQLAWQYILNTQQPIQVPEGDRRTPDEIARDRDALMVVLCEEQRKREKACDANPISIGDELNQATKIKQGRKRSL